MFRNTLYKTRPKKITHANTTRFYAEKNYSSSRLHAEKDLHKFNKWKYQVLQRVYSGMNTKLPECCLFFLLCEPIAFAQTQPCLTARKAICLFKTVFDKNSSLWVTNGRNDLFLNLEHSYSLSNKKANCETAMCKHSRFFYTVSNTNIRWQERFLWDPCRIKLSELLKVKPNEPKSALANRDWKRILFERINFRFEETSKLKSENWYTTLAIKQLFSNVTNFWRETTHCLCSPTGAACCLSKHSGVLLSARKWMHLQFWKIQVNKHL